MSIYPPGYPGAPVSSGMMNSPHAYNNSPGMGHMGGGMGPGMSAGMGPGMQQGMNPSVGGGIPPVMGPGGMQGGKS